GENLFDLVIAPSSQVLEPPQNPGRFTDVQTTMVYLHLINQLEAQSVLAHEDEIDMMFMAVSTPSI
ncbi:hypothetical protein ACV4W4_35415, partial [Pseudomonas aeruginosa]